MTNKKPASRDEKKRKLDDQLDEALKDSFPSSDPASISEPAGAEPQQPRKPAEPAKGAR
jgi:nicotinate phosphoribosyltransferase